MRWSQVFTLVGAIAAATVVHGYFFVPRVIQESRTEWRSDIDATIEPLKDNIAEIKGRLLRIEDKIDRLGK